MNFITFISFDLVIFEWVINSIVFSFTEWNLLSGAIFLLLFGIQSFIIAPSLYNDFGNEQFGWMFALLAFFMTQGV